MRHRHNGGGYAQVTQTEKDDNQLHTVRSEKQTNPMSKRKLPGGAAAAAEPPTQVGDENTSADIHQPSEFQGDSAPVLQPLAIRTTNGDHNKRAALDQTIPDSVQIQTPLNLDSNHGRVAPAMSPEHPAIVMSRAQDPELAVQPRMAPVGSPASEFLMASPNRNQAGTDTAFLTCDLSAITRDRWNKRRTLSAIVIAVLAIQTKAATVRRNVVLRDEHAECVCTVWGNHTNVLNESAIGRPITLQRVCLTEYEGKIQIAMPKDSSVSVGNTQGTAPILLWMQRAGSNMHTVQQVRCNKSVKTKLM
jgi:hypothetical protein